MSLIERTFRERIVLVGVNFPSTPLEETEAHLDELAQLIDTAGADEAARVLQRRNAPDAATFVGKGKAEELHELSETVDADTVVFDDELSPAQQRNLEKILGRTAIDRTDVILDIFAQNARTPEGRAQVELALLRHRLPRLRGRGKQLSQQAGAMGAGGARAPIGSRGPGETQLEVDRRRLLRRVTKLEADLKRLEKTRGTQRKARRRSRLPLVSIVGYTNAGKSTLLNRLTDADVLVEDRLFATLDPRTRRMALPGGESILVSDTVGFVRKLPHMLVEAFKATLEVVAESDLLVHVVDAATPDPDGQMDAVRRVLAEIGAGDVPELLAFNKADVTPEAKRLAAVHPGSVVVSARDGEGIDELVTAVGDRLRELAKVVELLVPYDRGDVVAAVHREGEVLGEEHEEAGTRLRARLDQVGASRFRELRRDLMGFEPPIYPYERLAGAKAKAEAHEGGMVDLSIGTPCDAPPPDVVEALSSSDVERGYPASIGSQAYREAAARWLERRFGVGIDPLQVAACVGTKEFVGTLPQYLRLRTPERDTILYPAVSYPTYQMGAILGGCRAVAVPVDEQFRPVLEAIEPDDAARALALWVNTPGNPAGQLDDLAAAAAWARDHGVPVFSDECYAEFTWDGEPRTVLATGTDGVVAVHSLSKRSNLAGLRAGFYAGDAELVRYLSEVRKHVGMLVPGPVQAAAVVALDDDVHVEVQRVRYLERMEVMSAILRDLGAEVATPGGGFYLWARVAGGDSWAFTEELAARGGALVSPGDLYGPAGAGRVRVALVQPLERIQLVADRLGA